MSDVMAVERIGVPLERLRARIDGHVSLPGDPDWDEARRAWNLVADQSPVAVAFPESAEDVQSIVEFAAARGLRVTTQGTGHFAATLDSFQDTILVRTSRMTGVEIDAERRVARAEAGVIWIDVVTAAAEHGLAALHGSSPDVGVVGYTLGGGMGWYARKLGLAANSVVAVEIVTAGGAHLRIDADNHPDLFWAVRGGGGSFGIVTAIEFALYPIREVYAGVLFFPLERASEVLNAWREWIADVPEDVTSVGRIMQFPPFPEVPEPLRGQSFAILEAAYLGDEEAGAELIRPLRELGPAMDTFAMVHATALARLHMDPEAPVPDVGDGMMLAELTAEAVDALVATAGADSGSPLVSVEVRHLGGELARQPQGHGAVGSLEGAFAVFAVGIAGTPEAGEAVAAHVDLVKGALAEWKAERRYFNFANEPLEDASPFYDEHTFARLRSVKARYDRADLFRAAHPIPPARSS